MKWLAYVMQKPLGQTCVALVIISKQGGTGKNTFTDPILALNGANAKSIGGISTIAGQFNKTLVGAHIIVGNELTNFEYDRR